MYLKIAPPASCGKFSRLIYKNPASPPYERDLSTGDDGSRRVTGRFTADGGYEVLVENDAVKLVDRLRAENKASYVSASPYAVNPRNLKCAATALKSALDGRADPENQLTAVDVAERHAFSAVVGPLCATAAEVRLIFGCVGLEVETEEPGAARMATLRGEASMQEFLQRVFLGAYALTARDHEQRVYQDSLVDSLVEMGRSWLGSCEGADRVIARVAGYRKSVVQAIKARVAEDQEEGPAADPRDPEARARLHDRRHATIVEAARAASPRRIVDLGCGDGGLLLKLLEALPEAAAVGVDAGERLKRAARRLRGRVRLADGNLTTPYLELGDLEPDMLVMSEVIEHLVEEDRHLAIRQVARMWRPRLLALTTPNVEYNERFGLGPGELRHRDHKVEYAAADLEREVLGPLRRAGYEPEVVPVSGSEHEDVQPSFVVLAKLTRQTPPDMRLLRQARDVSAPVALHEVGGAVQPQQVAEGLRHPVYRNYRRTAFYLSPTMAPVDHDPREPSYLEHPAAAFDYFAARGERLLVEQRKYMGSRCHLLVFRDEAAAARAGQAPLVAISRGGFPFFDPPEAAALWGRLKEQVRFEPGVDFVALDSEALPWSLKAGGERGLIAKEFVAPGEAAKMHAELAGRSAENAERFLRALSWFSGEGETELRAFDVLAYGSVTGDGKYRARSMVEEALPSRISWLETHVGGTPGPLRRATWARVDLDDPASRAASVARWDEYTHAGMGEGHVYKPASARADLQPALKVRGREYLRIIYGIDYLEPGVFPRLTKRATSGKRRVALLEAALGRRVLHAFFKGMRTEHGRAVAAFLGADGEAKAQLDATL